MFYELNCYVVHSIAYFFQECIHFLKKVAISISFRYNLYKTKTRPHSHSLRDGKQKHKRKVDHYGRFNIRNNF